MRFCMTSLSRAVNAWIVSRTHSQGQEGLEIRRAADRAVRDALPQCLFEGLLASENGDQIRIRMTVHVFADHVVKAVLTFCAG